MPTYQFADLASARVSSGGTTTPAAGTSESWTVSTATGTFPTLSAGQVFDVVDPAVPTELMTVTATASATAWTVTRGAYGTTPLAHLAGFTVRNVVTAAGLGALGTGPSVLHAAANPDTIVTGTITRDSNGAATSAGVTWPDGTTGTYTADTVSTAFPGAVDAYHVTYGSPVTKTYTQPAVTRDPSTGAVTNRPALTVA